MIEDFMRNICGLNMYLEFLYFLVQLLQQSLPNTYTQSVPSWFHDPLQNWLELLVFKGSLFTYVDKIK